MYRINTKEHYAALLDVYLNNRNDIIYNHILLPDKAEKYISMDHMFYEKHGNAIMFICEERDFYKLYYIIPQNEKIEILPKTKPHIIECFYKENRSLKKFLVSHEKNTSMGFKTYVKNLKLVANITEFENEILDKTPYLSYDFAVENDVKRLYELWTALDKYDSTIPWGNEVLEGISKRNIIVIREKDNICAAAHIKRENKKTASIWLVAVDKCYRGRGIGTYLYKAAFVVLHNLGYSYVSQWCDVNNSAVLKVAEKMGFSQDGLISQTYIL